MRSNGPIALYLTLLVSLAAPFAATALASPDRLVGLWGAERDFGPAISGPLTIARTSSGFTAAIGADHVPATLSGGELRFALPGNQGKFRGRLRGEALDGFWIQPATPILGVEYTSPIAFQRTKDRWTGTVAPLADRLTLYISISRQKDGKLSAFLRNPQMNVGRGRELAVTEAGDDIALIDPKSSQAVMTGKFKGGALALVYPGPDIGFTFARRDPATAIGFNERAPASPYIYTPPAASDDGWKTGTLADARIDETEIAALAGTIAGTRAAAGNTPYIDALLVARHGKLVFEDYFDGYDRDTPHTLRSAGKTLTSILLGAAIDHGAPIAVTTPVTSLFPEYEPIANPDSRKDKITIENLLTMSSGLSCDDDDDNSPGNEDVMQNQTSQPDWYKYTLDLPMLRAPGDRAVYCSGGVDVVFGALRNATHRWVPEMFDEYLARPLDIKRYYMNLTPTEDAYGGGGIFIRPRDALKFGQLYLDGGVWNGRHVVSETWVDASTATHSQDSRRQHLWLQLVALQAESRR